VWDVVPTTHPLQLSGRPDGLLLLRIQTRTLLYHDAAGLVLEVEQVLGIPRHRLPLDIELLSGEVASSL
jgi:hypothetical protein